MIYTEHPMHATGLYSGMTSDLGAAHVTSSHYHLAIFTNVQK